MNINCFSNYHYEGKYLTKLSILQKGQVLLTKLISLGICMSVFFPTQEPIARSPFKFYG